MTRLRHSYHVAALLAESDSKVVVQAWFQGMNPQLDDVPPARLREGQIDEAAQRWLYESTAVDGGTFTSRHGDELQLWAIFERPGDPAISPKLDRTQWSCIGNTHLSYLTTLPQAVGPYAFGIR